MANRPEGLSPNFNSIISPQIESSLIFSWTFIPSTSKDYQVNGTVNIYEEGSNAALLTVQTGQDKSVDLASRLTILEIDQSYEWEAVIVASDNSIAKSGRKTFKYVEIPQRGDLVWPDGPDPYEYIGTRQYFNEIQSNVMEVLEDYVVDSTEEIKMMEAAENLFSGDIVPARTDFVTLENILYLIARKEISYKDEVDELIEDGLGAQDIHKIYAFIDRLTKLPPMAPSNISMSFSNIVPLKIASGSIKNQGKADLTIDVKWQPENLDTATCEISVPYEMMEDVTLYHINLGVGFTDYSCNHSLYFRVEDLIDMDRIVTVPMDHVLFEHLSSTKITYYSISATAIDRRGEESTSYNKTYSVGNIPIGVSSYQLRTQQMDLLDKVIVKSYYDIYNGTAKAYVHTVKGTAKGVYHYAVRLHDKNGATSPWFYIPDEILINPLDPPAAPKPKIDSVTPSSIKISWASVKTATSYEIDPITSTGSNTTTTSLTKTYTGLKESTTYTYKVRATNAAGSSAWVTVSGKTSAKPIVTYTEKKIKSRTWRTSYYIHYQSGSVTRPAAEYRKELDNEEVIHGQWIELKDKVESGLAVKKGTKWGNHKSLYFLDYSDWQKRLAGKEITSVRFYIKRKSTTHGYPDDGRFLHVYSHNYTGVGSLPAASKGPTLSNHNKIEKLDWDRGEGHWVTLPKSYGEKLRDGKIKGFAFYHPTSDTSPYSYMRFDADTIQFQVKYK